MSRIKEKSITDIKRGKKLKETKNEIKMR